MQYASVTGFVRTILILLLIYYGIKILTRLFAPFLIKFITKKAQQRFGGQFDPFQKQQRQQKPNKEGDVTIDKMPNRQSSAKDVGEYIDYEEID